jgi:hypothetical protein
MKKSAAILEKERKLLASMKNDIERAQMRTLLDVLWANAVAIARLKAA